MLLEPEDIIYIGAREYVSLVIVSAAPVQIIGFWVF